VLYTGDVLVPTDHHIQLLECPFARTRLNPELSGCPSLANICSSAPPRPISESVTLRRRPGVCGVSVKKPVSALRVSKAPAGLRPMTVSGYCRLTPIQSPRSIRIFSRRLVSHGPTDSRDHLVIQASRKRWGTHRPSRLNGSGLLTTRVTATPESRRVTAVNFRTSQSPKLVINTGRRRTPTVGILFRNLI
jgi:hypothetical protein